jgi:hypothetical protein
MSAEYDSTKFQELILYVAGKSWGDENFGSTKLNKLLFYSDFRAFAYLGEAITGAVYQRLPKGPCAKPLLPALRALEENGDAVEVQVTHADFTQKRVIPRRPARLDLFTAAEIDLVGDVLNMLRNDTAKAVSDRSHDEWAWRAVTSGEEIPYSLALLEPHVGEDGMALALHLAEANGY